MKITVLAENTSSSADIGAEHGLSLYVEGGECTVLFDMGQTDLFARNAELLGADLSKVDVAILSHGHYDHGGGIAEFLRLNSRASVYVSKYAFGDFWDSEGKYIGIDKSLLQSGRLVLTEGDVELGGGMRLSHAANMTSAPHDHHLLECVDGEKRPDRFLHEQYLTMEEGRVLFSGCSHRGAMNILRHFSPQVMIGGFHFSSLPTDKFLQDCAEYMGRADTDFYTCHCTGEVQYGFMKDHTPRLNYIRAGMSITV